MQAFGRAQPLLHPGQTERRTHDDKRNGTTSLFMALDIHMDNCATYKTEAAGSPSARAGTFTTARPRGQIERFFGLLTEKQSRRGVHRSTADFERATVNDDPKPFRWTKTKFWLSGFACERWKPPKSKPKIYEVQNQVAKSSISLRQNSLA